MIKIGTLNVEGRESRGLLTGLVFPFVTGLISELVSEFVPRSCGVTRTKAGSCNEYETKVYPEGGNTCTLISQEEMKSVFVVFLQAYRRGNFCKKRQKSVILQAYRQAIFSEKS